VSRRLSVVDPRADDLYTLDPSEFTAARDRLAAELKKAGERDGAAEVKALRRPTVTAWALNQLARRHGDEVRLLLAASAEVARAQVEVSAGGETSAFRRLTKERRELVHRLAAAGTAVLDEREAGSGGGRRDALVTALEAASMDEEGGEALLAGRLTTEPQPAAGFGGFLTAAVASAEGTSRTGPSRGEVRAARDRAERARSAATEAAEAAAAAEEKAAGLERQLADARSRAGRARTRADEAAEAADEAERALTGLEG
jgi:hypothetical protein